MSCFSNQFNNSSSSLKQLNAKSTLNPNASEFIPFFPIPTSTNNNNATALSGAIEASSVSSIKGNLDVDRSNSSVSVNSDEEARRYWSCQLPDDITPDFNDEGIANISLEGLSLDDDGTDGLRSASSSKSRFLLNHSQDDYGDSSSFMTPVSFRGRSSSLNVNAKAWEGPTAKNNPLFGNKSNRPHPNIGKVVGDFVDDILSESGMDDSSEVDSLAFLAYQFPGYSYESLAEVFSANQHDLNSTAEMLTQLEHQVEGGSSKVVNSKSPSALNPNAPVFHSRAVHGARMQITSRDGLPQNVDPYQPPDKDRWRLFSPASSIPAQVSGDLDTGMGISSLQKSNSWKYEGTGSIDMGIGSSRRPDLFAPYISRISSFQQKASSPSSTNRTSFGTGYGQAVEIGNVHSEFLEDIPQHGGLLNTYLQQARPSFSMDKSPAKDLDFEAPLYNMVVKPEHLESKINRSHELNTVRSAARALEQSLPVCIRVGSEHLTRGPFTPAKLPAAIRRYLLEEERLNYSELQPGLLRVVIC